MAKARREKGGRWRHLALIPRYTINYYIIRITRVFPSPAPPRSHPIRRTAAQAVALVGENCARFRFCARRFITLSPSSILYSTSDAATDRGYVADRITLRDAHPRFILVLPRVSQKRVMRPESVLPRIEIYSLKLVRNWRRCTPSSVNEKKMLDC